MTRRYRDGRLVRSRRLRRATLQNDLNLVLQRIERIVCELRFALMVSHLAGHRAAAIEPVYALPAGCRSNTTSHEAEPDKRDDATDLWDAGVTAECRGGRTPAHCAGTHI